MDMAKPIISVERCAVSVMIAMEPERYPPMHYAMMKKMVTNETKYSFFLEAS
jgi:hypothetical protein